MVRGIDRQAIFRTDEDRENFVSRVNNLTLQTGTQILAWALMPTHAHLLLFSGRAGLPGFMRKLLTGYAVWFNLKHRRKGHLFENRYKSIVCEEDPYLLELVRYIHLNPLRSSVVKTLDELNRYRWSGHGVLLGKVLNDWQETEYVLRMFGGGKKKAIRAYLKFMEEGKNIGRRPELVGGGLIRSLGGWSRVISLRNRGGNEQYDSRILGRGDFVEAIWREAEEKLKTQLRHEHRKRSIQEAIRKMCTQAGVNEEELRGGNQRRKVADLRSQVAFRLNREMGISMAEVARQLGVGASAIAMAIRKQEKTKQL